MFNALILGNAPVRNSPELKIHQCDTIDSLNNLYDYDFIIVNGEDKEILATAFRLRNQGWLKPIVSVNRKSLFANFEFTNTSQFLTDIENTLQRHAQISNINLNDTYHNVLKYLFVYPVAAFSPVAGIYSTQLFNYAFQHIFQLDYAATSSIINELAELDLIIEKAYVDSCFCCSNCQSELLKFSENCPHCNSSNVIESKFIHCFKCGYVANETEFIESGGLRCKNCRTKLKLIGDDYDHPLESSKCMNCQEVFIEGNSSALCISCGHQAKDLGKLPKHIYHSYQINTGRDSKFLNHIRGETLYLFDKLNYASKDYFLQMLEWLIRLYARHSDEYFNLFDLQLDMADDTFNLRELSLAFKSILRTTDLYCRLGMGRVLILFPKSTDKDTNIIKEKLLKIVNATIGMSASSIRLNSYTADQLTNQNIRDLWFK